MLSRFFPLFLFDSPWPYGLMKAFNWLSTYLFRALRHLLPKAQVAFPSLQDEKGGLISSLTSTSLKGEGGRIYFSVASTSLEGVEGLSHLCYVLTPEERPALGVLRVSNTWDKSRASVSTPMERPVQQRRIVHGVSQTLRQLVHYLFVLGAHA